MKSLVLAAALAASCTAAPAVETVHYTFAGSVANYSLREMPTAFSGEAEATFDSGHLIYARLASNLGSWSRWFDVDAAPDSWSASLYNDGCTSAVIYGFEVIVQSLSPVFQATAHLYPTVVAVPEPGPLALLGAGLLAIAYYVRRRA